VELLQKDNQMQPSDFEEIDRSLFHTEPSNSSKHKLTEQKGRNKINAQIGELKELIPECKYVTTTKASILECTVNTVKKYQSWSNELMLANKKMQQEIRLLRQENLQLSLHNQTPTIDSQVTEPSSESSSVYKLSPDEWSSDSSPFNTLPGSSLDSGSSGEFFPLLQEQICGNLSLDQQEFVGELPLEQLPESPAIFQQENIAQLYQQETLAQLYQQETLAQLYVQFPYLGNGFDPLYHPVGETACHSFNPLPTNDIEPRDVTLPYKVSRRKLFAFFALLLPFMCSSYLTLDATLSASVTSKILETLAGQGTHFLDIIQHLDIVHTLLWLLLGAIGSLWTWNCVLWFKDLDPKHASYT